MTPSPTASTNTGRFHAQRQRKLALVQAGAVVDIDGVEAAGMVADADLAGAGSAHGDIDGLQDLGSAELLDLDGMVPPAASSRWITPHDKPA